MITDRFTSTGPVLRSTENTERWHERATTAESGINTIGPWVGIADEDDEFGYNPLTGERYYIDDTGVWQPVPADLDGTHELISGLAPAQGVIPAEVSSQTRDDGDFHSIQYDDYVVVYKFPAVEIRRTSTGDGGFEHVLLSAPSALEPSLELGWLREYTLTATAPLTATTVDGQSIQVVEYTIPAPTANGQRIDIIRSSSEMQYLNGNINDDASGGIINEDNRKIQLASLGATWLWSH